MIRYFLLFFLCLAAPAAIPVESDSLVGVPDRDTPRELAEVWLRFHEAELCQGVDAVFVFAKDGMEVRSVIHDEKSYQKLEALLEPLRSSYRIELHPSRPPEEEEPDDGRNPPASLWENYTLRSFLGDPYARARERSGFEDQALLYPPPVPDDLLKQRLLIYSEQILDWSGKMERYAGGLPALAALVLDPAIAPELRSQAYALSRTHAQEMKRYAEKLRDNLEPAFPRGGKEVSARPERSGGSATPVDRARHMSEFAEVVAVRIRQFIYPERFTVGLDELRQPGLLESLKTLQKMESDFQKALAKARPE